MKKWLSVASVVVIFVAGSLPAGAETFTGGFSGAAEDPPNDSSGTGTAEVELDAVEHILRIDVSFSELDSPTTIAHIHCCAPPGEGANVATTVPTFPDFPAGVMSGTYQMTFDTTEASTFSPAFISANGGTPEGAEAALLAGLTSGMAYFNIHTETFGAGEIRADLGGGEPTTPSPTGTPDTPPAPTPTATPAANPATFTGNFSGAAEDPPNDSSGTGTAEVELDPVEHVLRIDVSFSELDSPTTIAHIHCCAPPGESASVATTVPTFPGFPAGVMSGTYQMTFDTTQASTFSPAFVTANGGTPEGAEAALLAGLTSGMAYFNIHTETFGAGEIRADLAAGEPTTPSPTGTPGTDTPTPGTPGSDTPTPGTPGTDTPTPSTPVAGTATATGEPTSAITSPTPTSGPSGTATAGSASPTPVGTRVITATATPRRVIRTPRRFTEDDSCSIVVPPQSGGAWILLFPAALLLLARRRR